jgi:hypothetical protein
MHPFHQAVGNGPADEQKFLVADGREFLSDALN